MRTATDETRRELRRALAASPSRRAWALAHDVSPVDVSDCLNRRPMSAKRENRLRAAMGLPVIRFQTIDIADNQRVVTITPPRTNKRRAATMTPQQAAIADEMARRAGYRSWGAFAVGELLSGGSVDELYTGQNGRNGSSG